MATITLPKSILAAVFVTAAGKDVRFYLNGVFIDTQADGSALVMAADGHRITIARVESASDGPCEPFLIPNTLVKSLLRYKGKLREKDPALALTIEGDVLTCLDASVTGKVERVKYPDWRRVIPKGGPEPSDVVAPGADYVGDTGTQAVALGLKPHSVYITRYPTSYLATFGNRTDIFSVIMPRSDMTAQTLPTWAVPHE